MFLVNDDQSEIRKRGKQRRPRPQHDTDPAVGCPFHLLISLRRGHPGIHHRHTISEVTAEPTDILIRQRDLRNQHDRLPAFPQRLLDQPDINHGLPAAGHPLQQTRPILFFPFPQDPLRRFFLETAQSKFRHLKFLSRTGRKY